MCRCRINTYWWVTPPKCAAKRCALPRELCTTYRQTGVEPPESSEAGFRDGSMYARKIYAIFGSFVDETRAKYFAEVSQPPRSCGGVYATDGRMMWSSFFYLSCANLSLFNFCCEDIYI